MSATQEASPARLEAFSDGVFAIIITLLVLDLRVPRSETIAGGGLGAALLALWPNYLAFLISFSIVGVVWANHHAMFRYVARIDHSFLVLNGLLLLCVAVIPFSAAVLAEFIEGAASDQRVAARLYAGSLVLGGLFFNGLWWYAARAGLCRDARDAAALRAVGAHWRWGPVLYGIAFVVTWISVPLSIAMYVALILRFGISGSWVVS